MSIKETKSSANEHCYDFSNTMWYGAELGKLKSHVGEHLDLISSYPERSAETLRRLLSRRLEVDENELLVTDGATGAIHLIARVIEGSKSLVVKPSHIEFKHALDVAQHEVVECSTPVRLSQLDLTGTEYVWLSTPNAVDGKLYSRRSLLNLIQQNPDTTFIVDLSTSFFVLEDTLKPSDIKKYSNLILISSFSNAYNLAGLRVGYVVAKQETIQHLDREYTPRCVGTLAMEAIRFILIHPAQFTIPIRKWHRNAKELIQELENIEGLEVQPSGTPYFVVRLHKGTAGELDSYLSRKYGIKVGTSHDDIDLSPSEIRICAQEPEANHLLIKGVKEWFDTL